MSNGREQGGQPEQALLTEHRIQLTARDAGERIVIDGNGGRHLNRDSGAHRFEFELDPKGLGVAFKQMPAMLDAKDNVSACPPPSGMDTNQIRAVTRQSDTRAGFTDLNNNRQADMPVSYQLHFDCPTKSVEPFDPIITNGGETR